MAALATAPLGPATGALLAVASVARPVTGTGASVQVLPLGRGDGWELHSDLTATESIIAAIGGAKTIVNAEFFGVSDAGKGAALTRALVDAASRGVKVNVIADAASMTGMPPFAFFQFKRKIEAAGGEVKMSVGLPLLRNALASKSLRDVTHRKVVAIDGAVAYTGGINYLKMTDHYHDAMIKLTGANAARLAHEQLTRWEEVGGTITAPQRAAIADGLKGASLVTTDRADFRVLENSPEKGHFGLGDSYVAAIRGAKERLWITSPGFSDSKVIDEIKDAIARGVDVRIIAPGKPPLGVPIINWVGRAHHKELIAAGAKVYEVPQVVHLKALIADDEAILSSYNVTVRSRRHDHEIGVQSANAEFVKSLSGLLESDMQRSKQLQVAELDDFGTKVGNFLVNTLHLNY